MVNSSQVIVQRYIKMFRDAAEGKTWHGQSVLKTLENISAEEAATRPIAESHCIWDYLLHIINWREYAVRNILDDKPYVVDLNTDKDWTPISDYSEEAWKAALKLYKQSTEDLVKAMETMDDDRLDEAVPESKYTFYTMLHGVIHHDIYHSGQIVLLKKMLKK